jgi:hypothetical protein
MTAVGVFEAMATGIPAPRSGRGQTRRPPAMVALLLLASVVFLTYAWRVIPAPFGDSHDGRNAGVWAVGARALAEEGPVESRLGTRSPELGTYANHPPLITVETAAAEAVAGESPAATRAPAWVGSLVTIWLLAAVLREQGLRGVAVGTAVVLAVATPMFMVFGTMLDTPVTSLPLGLALVLMWERVRHGRPLNRPLGFTVAALAVLAGWQSFLLAACVAGWALVRTVRARQLDGHRDEMALVAGASGGAALLLGWLWWAFGGTIRPLRSAYLLRSGATSGPVPMGELVARVLHDGWAMFGIVALLGALGIVVALSRPSTRGLAAVALVVTVPYPLIFRTGAINHEYWNYWFLLPLALGLAAGGDWVLGVIRDRRRAELGLAAAALSIGALGIAGVWLERTAPGWSIREGVRAGAVAEAGALAADQGAAWYTGAVGRPASWLSIATRRPAVPVDPAEMARLAAERPGDHVFVGRGQCVGGVPRITYGWETPAGVLANPPDVSLCRAR